MICQVGALLQIGAAKAAGGFSGSEENLLSRRDAYEPAGHLDQISNEEANESDS